MAHFSDLDIHSAKTKDLVCAKTRKPCATSGPALPCLKTRSATRGFGGQNARARDDAIRCTLPAQEPESTIIEVVDAFASERAGIITFEHASTLVTALSGDNVSSLAKVRCLTKAEAWALWPFKEASSSLGPGDFMIFESVVFATSTTQSRFEVLESRSSSSCSARGRYLRHSTRCGELPRRRVTKLDRKSYHLTKKLKSISKPLLRNGETKVRNLVIQEVRMWPNPCVLPPSPLWIPPLSFPSIRLSCALRRHKSGLVISGSAPRS